MTLIYPSLRRSSSSISRFTTPVSISVYKTIDRLYWAIVVLAVSQQAAANLPNLTPRSGNYKVVPLPRRCVQPREISALRLVDGDVEAALIASWLALVCWVPIRGDKKTGGSGVYIPMETVVPAQQLYRATIPRRTSDGILQDLASE
ncbi:hypothetical protein Tco_0569032 [Tanacetum coccineum]